MDEKLGETGKKTGGNTFDIEYMTEYSDVDSNYRMKVSRIAACFQQLATLHSNAAGYPLKVLSEMGLGWILTHWHIQIRRFPNTDEKLTVSTWSIPKKRIQAQRDFSFTDESGDEIVYASSMWAIMNLETRWPWRMTKDFYNPYLLENSREVLDDTFPKLKASDLSGLVTPDTEIVERIFAVMRRDTDTNRHVNNVVYIDWAMDNIPDDIYDGCFLYDVRVSYIRECRKGCRIRSSFYLNRVPSGYSTVSVFSDADDESVVYCEVMCEWRQV